MRGSTTVWLGLDGRVCVVTGAGSGERRRKRVRVPLARLQGALHPVVLP